MANAGIYHLLVDNGVRPHPACKTRRSTMAMSFADFKANPEVTMCEKCRRSKALAALEAKHGALR